MPYEVKDSPAPEPPILALPLEIRQQIYSFLLPRTVIAPNKHASGLVWQRGNIALLATCKQIHDEAIAIIYGDNTFNPNITNDGINLRYSWLLPSGLTPSCTKKFLEYFGEARIKMMRRLVVQVTAVDSYLGMIKYNCAGRGLIDGLRDQVQNLADVLQDVELWDLEIHLNAGNKMLNDLRKVRVHKVERERDVEGTQIVLEPFKRVRARRVVVQGAVTEDYADELQRSILAGG